MERHWRKLKSKAKKRQVKRHNSWLPFIKTVAPIVVSIAIGLPQIYLASRPLPLPPKPPVVSDDKGISILVPRGLRLKTITAHAENPSQEKLAPGVARLLRGGDLTTVPSVTQLIQSTPFSVDF